MKIPMAVRMNPNYNVLDEDLNDMGGTLPDYMEFVPTLIDLEEVVSIFQVREGGEYDVPPINCIVFKDGTRKFVSWKFDILERDIKATLKDFYQNCKEN